MNSKISKSRLPLLIGLLVVTVFATILITVSLQRFQAPGNTSAANCPPDTIIQGSVCVCDNGRTVPQGSTNADCYAGPVVRQPGQSCVPDENIIDTCTTGFCCTCSTGNRCLDTGVALNCTDYCGDSSTTPPPPATTPPPPAAPPGAVCGSIPPTSRGCYGRTPGDNIPLSGGNSCTCAFTDVSARVCACVPTTTTTPPPATPPGSTPPSTSQTCSDVGGTCRTSCGSGEQPQTNENLCTNTRICCVESVNPNVICSASGSGAQYDCRNVKKGEENSKLNCTCNNSCFCVANGTGKEGQGCISDDSCDQSQNLFCNKDRSSPRCERRQTPTPPASVKTANKGETCNGSSIICATGLSCKSSKCVQVTTAALGESCENTTANVDVQCGRHNGSSLTCVGGKCVLPDLGPTPEETADYLFEQWSNPEGVIEIEEIQYDQGEFLDVVTTFIEFMEDTRKEIDDLTTDLNKPDTNTTIDPGKNVSDLVSVDDVLYDNCETAIALGQSTICSSRGIFKCRARPDGSFEHVLAINDAACTKVIPTLPSQCPSGGGYACIGADNGAGYGSYRIHDCSNPESPTPLGNQASCNPVSSVATVQDQEVSTSQAGTLPEIGVQTPILPSVCTRGSMAACIDGQVRECDENGQPETAQLGQCVNETNTLTSTPILPDTCVESAVLGLYSACVGGRVYACGLDHVATNPSVAYYPNDLIDVRCEVLNETNIALPQECPLQITPGSGDNMRYVCRPNVASTEPRNIVYGCRYDEDSGLLRDSDVNYIGSLQSCTPLPQLAP